jgi:ketosteroid isomerase-like protein
VTDAEIIAAAERDIAAAHLTLDLGVLERLYHDDFILAQPDGTRESKADIVASFRTGDHHWDNAAVDELTIRVSGDTGVVIGRWRASGRNRGTLFDYAARFLSVWTRTKQGWQNLAYQSVEIPR